MNDMQQIFCCPAVARAISIIAERVTAIIAFREASAICCQCGIQVIEQDDLLLRLVPE
jgi:hypothetical protein